MATKKNVKISTVENKRNLLIRLVLAALFTYLFASLAIDSGSYWHYLLTFLSIGIAVNAAGRLVKDVLRNHGPRRAK